jgi:hypothetical protein
MIRKMRVVMLSAFLAALVAGACEGVGAFELFPRPEGQYTVRRGDTLYGIAGHYYSNAALWPFLWNQNPAIRLKDRTVTPDKESLTPGMKIDLFASKSTMDTVNQQYLRPTGIPDDVRFFINNVPYEGIPYPRRYFTYKLSSRPISIWGYIVSSPELNKNHYLERDLIYIRFRPSKKQAILVGDRLGIFRDQGPLHHPLNPNRPTGYYSRIVGEVEITSTGNELITGIIIDSYEEIVRGDKICLFAPRPREIVPTKTHRMLTGTILASATKDSYWLRTNNLENDIVFIDRGECDGMQEGILLNIYRPTTPIPDPYYRSRRLATPDTHIGEGMVLKTFEKNSTVLITRSREEIIPGDVIKSVSD